MTCFGVVASFLVIGILSWQEEKLDFPSQDNIILPSSQTIPGINSPHILTPKESSTDNWISYTSQVFGVGFQYPPDWIVEYPGGDYIDVFSSANPYGDNFFLREGVMKAQFNFHGEIQLRKEDEEEYVKEKYFWSSKDATIIKRLSNKYNLGIFEYATYGDGLHADRAYVFFLPNLQNPDMVRLASVSVWRPHPALETVLYTLRAL